VIILETKNQGQVFKSIRPNILYYGTPVILLSTLNQDGTTNISPLSSSWALGNNIVLGIGVGGKALKNLQKKLECVINIPSSNLWENIERMASSTGVSDVPDYKKDLGFTYVRDKYSLAGLTPQESYLVKPTRIEECPLQIEAKINNIRIPEYDPTFAIVETQAIHIHASELILKNQNHIDPNQWNPLIYNFRHYYGLGKELGKTFRA
jgi:flavin reductase (DIM6/NTAB) family NADH-FMN oxidoreductase RutF